MKIISRLFKRTKRVDVDECEVRDPVTGECLDREEDERLQKEKADALQKHREARSKLDEALVKLGTMRDASDLLGGR
jgi:hypothetical protein